MPSQNFSRGVFTIHASFGFATSLAKQMIEIAIATEPKQWLSYLSTFTLYLPNRRSIGVVKSALLQAVQEKNPKGGGLLLPKIISLGDIGGELDNITNYNDDEFLTDDIALPQILSYGQRLRLLMRLIEKFYQGGFERDLTPGHLLALAKKLARFFDELTIGQHAKEKLFQNDIFANLENIPEDLTISSGGETSHILTSQLAEHWKKILNFLKIIVPAYEQILNENLLCDHEQLLNKKMAQLADVYQKTRPSQPVIIAGSTGSRASTRYLMKSVLTLKNGMVILPGFDKDMEDDIWNFLSSSGKIAKQPKEKSIPFLLSALVHPQRSMVNLLKFLNTPLEAVRYFNHNAPTANIIARQQLLGEVFLPPTKNWLKRNQDNTYQNLQNNIKTALDTITILTTPDRDGEADMISLIIKQQMVKNDKTITLVSLDKQLIRQVLLNLAREGILVEDSSGTEFWQSPLGIFIFITSRFFSLANPASLKHLLCHPIILSSQDKNLPLYSFLEQINLDIESDITREKFITAINQLSYHHGKNKFSLKQKNALLNWLEPMMVVLDTSQQHTQKTISQWLKEFINFITTISKDDKTHLFTSDAKKKFQQMIDSFIHHQVIDDFSMTQKDFHDWLYELLADETLHRPFLQLDRLKIVGPLESRLLKSDITILAGLTEGVWPRSTTPDPWLPKTIRRHWGLPSDEEKLSLSAHDFATNFLSPEIFLLSREKENGVDLEKSRWLQRLEALLHLYPDAKNKIENRKQKWQAILQRHHNITNQYLPQPFPSPATPPSPKPPLTSRPKQLSVTEIEKFIANPFWLYGKKILKLTKPNDAADDHTAQDKGKLLHKILKEFIEQKSHHPSQEQIFLYELCDTALTTYQPSRVVKNFWQEVFYQSCDVFWQHYQSLAIKQSWVELNGKIDLSLKNYSFVLTARADRIDIDKNGKITIIDYKTGALPISTKRQSGESLQLPLEGLMVAKNGFPAITTAKDIDLEFWHLCGKESKIEKFDKTKRNDSKQTPALITTAKQKLQNIIHQLADADYGFTACEEKTESHYELLARTGEWAGQFFIEEDNKEEEDNNEPTA
ncbi:MAG: double-strand break repair protein AddB [Alphaproteobacteria bacterium]